MSRLTGQSIWVMAKGYAPDEGGMQTYARAVAEAYAQKGAHVTVITQTSIGPRQVRIGGVEVIDIGPGKSPLVLWQFYRTLKALEHSQGQPDFVHATTWRTAVPAILAGHPYAVTFHGREFMYAQGLMLRLMRHVACEAVRCVAVSNYSARKLKQRLGDGAPDIGVAWNGVTPGLPFAVANMGINHPPVLFSLCRLEARKNVRRSVLAAAHCHDIGLVFRFILCGRGPDYGSIAQLIDELPVSANIEMAGFVEQSRAERYYAKSDIFLHPQISIDDDRDFEGFGIAIADAMYCGQAVIVGDAGGPAEFVTNGRTGIVVDGRDTKALEAALEQLLTDHKLRQRIGLDAARWARTYFRWDRHVEIVMGHRLGV